LPLSLTVIVFKGMSWGGGYWSLSSLASTFHVYNNYQT